MLLAHYYALATGATLLTAAWLFRPRERVRVTTLGGFLAWGLVALLGDSTEVYDEAIQETATVNNTTVAVQTTGELVSAPVPDELRFFAAFWAILSALTLLLAVWGVYPPTEGETRV
jgi:hypothetical protein